MNSKILELLANPNLTFSKRGLAPDLRHVNKYTSNRFMKQPEVQPTIKTTTKQVKQKDNVFESIDELLTDIKETKKRPTIKQLRKKIKKTMDYMNEHSSED
jgi:hypothetical protein